MVVIPHVHYRLVLRTVGFGLDRFDGTKELLHATHDAYQGKCRSCLCRSMLSCITAMVDANEHRILHRDISLGNIILVRDKAGEIRRGCLIDWEFSYEDKGEKEAPRQYERTVSA